MSIRKTLVLALSLAIFSTACSTAWVTTLDSILSAAAPALVNILQIVAVANGRPLNGNLVARINTDASDIKTLAANLAAASAASAPGACQQLQAAVGAYQSDQQLVLQLAQVSDPNTQTKITLLAGLVASTIDSIVAVIPSCEAAAAPQARQTMPVARVYDASSFAARYNRILTAPTGNRAVDTLTPKLKLHRHSALARMVSLGRLR